MTESHELAIRVQMALAHHEETGCLDDHDLTFLTRWQDGLETDTEIVETILETYQA